MSVSIFLLPDVHADFIPGPFKELAISLFTKVPDTVTERSILAIIFGILCYFGCSFFIRDKSDPKRFEFLRIALAVVLGVMTAIGVPEFFLQLIFGIDKAHGGLWGSVGGLLVVFTPIIVLILFATKLPSDGPASLGRVLVLSMAVVIISVLQSVDNVHSFVNGSGLGSFKISDMLLFVQLGLLFWVGIELRKVFQGMGGDRAFSGAAQESAVRGGFNAPESEGRIKKYKDRLRHQFGKSKASAREAKLEEETARVDRAEEAVEVEASASKDAGSAITEAAKHEEELARVRTEMETKFNADLEASKAIMLEEDATRKRDLMRGALETIRKDVGAIVEQEKSEERYKKEGIKKLNESLVVMREGEVACVVALKGATQASRRLKALTSKEFDGLDDYVRKKEKSIAELVKQAKMYSRKADASKIPAEAQGFKATAGSIGRQAEKLQGELEIQRKKVEQLKTLKPMLETNQGAISDVLQRNVMSQLADIKNVHKGIYTLQRKGVSALEKTYSAKYQELVTAFQKNSVAAKLADPANPPETVIPEETAELGGVFACLISIQATSKEFFHMICIPWLNDAVLVVDKAKGIENSLGYIDKAIDNLVNAYVKFDEACIELQDNPKKKLELQEIKKLEDAEALEAKMKVEKEPGIISEYDKIKEVLVKDIQAVRDHISFIDQDMAYVASLQKTVLGRLEDLQKALTVGTEKKDVAATDAIKEAEKSAGAAANAAATAAGTAPPGT